MKFLVTHSDNSTRIIEAKSYGLARLQAMAEAAAQHGIEKDAVPPLDCSYLGWDRRLIISSVSRKAASVSRSILATSKWTQLLALISVPPQLS